MKYLIIIAIILQSYLSYSQKWDETYGNSYTGEYFEDVIECYDKGYLISGANDISPYPNLLIKTDINGSVLWERKIQHNIYNVGKGAIDQNNKGEIAITRFLSFPNGDQWPSVVKLDSCGNKLWCRVFIDDEYSHGWFEDVILFDNGDVLALGYLQSLENYNERIFLYYIDNNGTLIWRESYASKEDHPLVLERTGSEIHKFDNEYVISGWCAYPYPGNPGTGYSRPFFIGIDNEFKEKWILPFGVSDSILGQANDVIPLNDSVYMGLGYMWVAGSIQNSLYMFFNEEGEEFGYTQITNDDIGPEIQTNIPTSFARMNDTLFVASTFFESEEDENSFGEITFDTAGYIYNVESRPNSTGISTLIKTFDNKYVIGCSFKHPNSDWDIYLYKINDSLEMDTIYPGNYTYDSLCPYQIESGTIDISDCLLITDVGEVPTPGEYFASLNTVHIKAYPNPVNGNQVTFEFQNTEHLTSPSVPPAGGKPPHLCIYNVFGEKVHEERVYPYQGESKVNVDSWQQGMYIALIYSNGKVVGQRKFVVQ